MTDVRNISYHVIQTDHADQAASLALYLTEHGVPASQVNDQADSVELAVPDVETFSRVELLKTTWAIFWENTDTGLFGLPIYVKD